MNPLAEICREIDKMLAGDQCACLVIHLAEAEIARIPAAKDYLDHLLAGVFAAARRYTDPVDIGRDSRLR